MIDPALAAALELARRCATEPITVTDLADEAGYSPFHFTRRFTLALGVPPGQFLTALRIDAAKRLLLAEPDPVIDVATAVGFDSLSSFSRRFRNTVGVPPAGFRRLADRVADRPPRPFSLLTGGVPTLRVHLDVLPADRPSGELSLWVGWYPQPAPIGLPAQGMLVADVDTVELPLCPGNPWLLGFAVPLSAQVQDQLTPVDPLVAVHPAEIVDLRQVTLSFRRPGAGGIPLLSALPSLCRH